ncbi:MAG: hypothetical protein ACPL4K_05945 [Candidatus Margulisiibacteriota bacterium]
MQDQGKDKKEEIFKCRVCGLTYREKEWADKCQEWCSTHDSCNLEVIMHSIEAEKSK